MEQRIGASSKPSEAEPLTTEPVTGAGFDPAYIPGITVPAPAKPAERADAEQADAGPEDARPEPEAEAEREEDTEGAGAAESAESVEDTDEADDEAGADGPVFEASDRRARIVADRKGVRLSLDEEACEFRWDEIAAVETESARFGKRFTITVHTPDRRWYPIEIEAPARSRFAEWDQQLDAVLDAYFEDGD
ncbi:hypothetical protein [Streptomyces sp. NPDC127190]|uniref:hypothetical protein n=1 Tax=unclassified Streptomyces TaxID=2593676 RepID=UPI00362970A8